jgi:hypothetical protein
MQAAVHFSELILEHSPTKQYMTLNILIAQNQKIKIPAAQTTPIYSFQKGSFDLKLDFSGKGIYWLLAAA